MEVEQSYIERDQKQQVRSTAFISSLALKFPGFGFEKLPPQVDSMMFKQFQKGRALAEDPEQDVPNNVSIPGWEGFEEQLSQGSVLQHTYVDAQIPVCKCSWYRTWQLPCCHIFHHHLLFNSLQPEHFVQFVHVWSENGFEIYEEITNGLRESAGDIIGVPEVARLNVNSITQGLTEHIHETARRLKEDGYSQSEINMGLGKLVETARHSLRGALIGFDMKAFFQRSVNKEE